MNGRTVTRKIELAAGITSYCQMRPDGKVVVTLREGGRLIGVCVDGVGSHPEIAMRMLQHHREKDQPHATEVVISEVAQQWNQKQFEAGDF